MSTAATAALTERFDHALSDAARTWWEQALQRVEEEGAEAAIPVLLPALARRVGRDRPAEGVRTDPDVTTGGRVARVNLAAWRSCDVAGLRLLSHPDVADELIVDLWLHGDFEEREIVCRAAQLLPATSATATLFGEAQRTNTMTHFEALCCDGNLPARAVGIPGFGLGEFNRLVLKAAFSDLPLARLFDATDHANQELSRMLQDLATEREAAGRRIWADTDRMVAGAPAAGSTARLLGGIEHGDDRRRLAAAEGLLALDHPEFLPLVLDRIGREPRELVRRTLERVATRWSTL